MSSGLYGGDEVGALVLDPGHYSFRVGYAGEECPKAEIPGVVGCIQEDGAGAAGGGDAGADATAEKSVRYVLDTNSTHLARPGMELEPYLQDGMIHNWDRLEAVVHYAYKRYLMTEPGTHPVLMTEPPWNTKAKREQLTEVMFEKLGIPAFFLCKTAVLAAFANGRQTGLVLDSGATHTSAIPVFDGYCLTSAISRTPLGGDAVSQQCEDMLEKRGVEIIPPYLVGGKEAVGLDETPLWTRRKKIPEVTKSFHSQMVKEVVQDFQATVLQASDTPYDEDTAGKLPALHYEFPNGLNSDFGAERLRIAEALFNPAAYLSTPELYEGGGLISGGATGAPQGVASVLFSSVGRCDVDVRPALYNSVILTGGNSLIQGFTERVQTEMQAGLPANTKQKLYAATLTGERRFGAWIGGSILASLGSFQQMWVSKQEFDETGKSIVDKKCP